uniref:NADH-ubiquinone oxidoreductase chain 2 n=1 Tax=Scymninae sp. 2 ACP-2013 TaxID=1434583 RepID=A0A3G3ME36_9CUCU|nr:NADH dehydrogenase subunit 2 [Scymninae sp. 2 ACP-2013]
MKMNKILFLNTLILSTLISISAYNWFTMWIGLEINLLSFIPLMNDSKNILSSEASIKYFIVQAISSMMILFAFLMTLLMNDFLMEMKFPFILIMSSSLLMKLGAAPFHFWFPEMIEGLSWFNALILLTWQKIAPMILLMYNFNFSYFFILVILSSLLISGLNNWNQTKLKKIMAFSSMNHLGWMLSILFFNQSLWLFYFFIYTFLTLNLVWMFNWSKIMNLSQIFSFLNFNKYLKYFFFLNFFSLGGIPPFLGFFPKWLILNILIQNNFLMLAFMMIFLTLLTLFVYIRIMFQAFTLNFIDSKILSLNISMFQIFFINFMNIFGLMIFTMIFNFF